MDVQKVNLVRSASFLFFLPFSRNVELVVSIIIQIIFIIYSRQHQNLYNRYNKGGL
jgi:hypothetical protein